MSFNFETIAPLLLGLAVPFLAAAIAFGSHRVMSLPSVKRVKSAYPVINVALQAVANFTNGSPYDFVFDAAAAFWGGASADNKEAAKLAATTVEFFKKSKFRGTDFSSLNPQLVAEGEALGAKIIAGLKASKNEA